MSNPVYDYLIVGGGIFGSYAAKSLAPNATVALIEKENSLFSRASKNNQTRLHTGCHYLRAPRTALDAQTHHDRFLAEHEFAMNKTFSHIYGIARHGSLTDARGFERFCDWLGIDARKQSNFDLLDPDRISDSYLVEEHTFDPFLLSSWYSQHLQSSNVALHLGSEIVAAKRNGSSWLVEVKDSNSRSIWLEAKCVINATYSNLNSISKLFDLPEVGMKHEYSELLLAYVPSLQNMAITIMDGPFLSITPYGLTGLHVLSSVIYTHHSSTENSSRKLPCQVINRKCTVDAFDLCQMCEDKPESAQQFMLNQLRTFMPNIGPIFVHGQLETVKSTWDVNDYRDERQTSVRKLASEPSFYAVMSGKVSNIYEMEDIFNVS